MGAAGGQAEGLIWDRSLGSETTCFLFGYATSATDIMPEHTAPVEMIHRKITQPLPIPSPVYLNMIQWKMLKPTNSAKVAVR
jgi:hypothetical protein